MLKDEFKSLLLLSILIFSQSVNGNIVKEAVSAKEINQSIEEVDFSTDVLNVSEQHLSPSFWISNITEKPQIIMTPQKIHEFNQNLFDNNPHVMDPLTLPNSFSKQELLSQLSSISIAAKSERFYFDGHKLNQHDYHKYFSLLNKIAIKETNQVKFALVLKRSILRTFPTYDAVYSEGKDKDLDRFQESGVFPGEAIAVLHYSVDKEWAFVRSYNYLAWMPTKDFAIGNKSEIANFKKQKDFIVVTGAKIFTSFVPNMPKSSNIQLDMGTKLPLVKRTQYSHQINGQNPYTSFVVQLPTKNSQNKLEFVAALIPRTQDVHRGYLAYTKQNLIEQSFKFLGERYGWGHSYNGRDCTGFIGEIYKSFGLLMPRNSGQQGRSRYGINFRFDSNMEGSSKLKFLKSMQIGDLIYISGHVMMFLGTDEGRAFIIHDVKDFSYLNENGELYKGTLNGVSVTPLLPLFSNSGMGYIDEIYNVKRIQMAN